jgi:hypothetical protein
MLPPPPIEWRVPDAVFTGTVRKLARPLQISGSRGSLLESPDEQNDTPIRKSWERLFGIIFAD